MFRRSLAAAWPRCAGAYLSAALVSGCLGGQSGGETNDEAVHLPDAPAACACIAAGEHAIHGRVTRLEAGCAELVVVELLDAPSSHEYMPLEVGATFGGVVIPLCAGGPEVNEGDDVFARFSRGTQNGVTCPEYRACSNEHCGDPTTLTTTTIAGECAERRARDPNVDCPPLTVSDEAALAEYDRCDTQCLEETRDTCAGHANETQLGGTVWVAPWDDGMVSFYWAGEQRREAFGQLLEPACEERHARIWSSYYIAHGSNTPNDPNQQDVAKPPPSQPGVTCPLPPRQ